MVSISHPNVVRVYDVGVIIDAGFLTMELVRGTTLREWVEAPRDPNEVIRAMTNAGRGPAAAHASGIVHRDLKPANVLVDRRGAVKVADFELFANQPLFPSGTAAEAPAGFVDLQLRRLRRDVGSRLWYVLARGLTFDPAARYPTMNQLLYDLERTLMP